MELQTGEIPIKISVDDIRLRIWENIRPWNWGVRDDLITYIIGKGLTFHSSCFSSLCVNILKLQLKKVFLEKNTVTANKLNFF